MKITGKIVKGKGEGRLLGFPTANLQASQPVLLADGVYLAKTLFNGVSYHSLVVRGLVDDLEVHLLNFDGDLYNEELIVEVGNKISEIAKIADMEILKQKIKEDIATAKKIWKIN